MIPYYLYFYMTLFGSNSLQGTRVELFKSIQSLMLRVYCKSYNLYGLYTDHSQI
jgi:hypothetical protein